MAVFTSAKSAQYVEILRQRRTKTSRILEVTPRIQVVDVTLGGSNTAVIRELAQSTTVQRVVAKSYSNANAISAAVEVGLTCVVTTHSVSSTETASGGVAVKTLLHIAQELQAPN